MLVIQAPLRVSLLGGGTDFEGFYREHGGAVLSTAIDKSVYVIIKERFDDKIYVNWSKKEIVDRVEDIEHDLVRNAMFLTGITKGVEITTLSDIPAEGSGLGSSSSITVGLLHALYTYRGILPTAEQLAQEACKIEIDILGKPIGKQDQYIAAYGGMRLIEFSKAGIVVTDIGLTSDAKIKLKENMMLFYTGITRSADVILEEQKDNISHRLSVLKKMASLACRGKGVLVDGDYRKFGRFLDYGWYLKKQLASGVSNSDIDDMCLEAKTAGAIGVKVLGAGGGGFLLVFCGAKSRKNVRKALSYLREVPFSFAQDGSKVLFNYRR